MSITGAHPWVEMAKAWVAFDVRCGRCAENVAHDGRPTQVGRVHVYPRHLTGERVVAVLALRRAGRRGNRLVDAERAKDGWVLPCRHCRSRSRLVVGPNALRAATVAVRRDQWAYVLIEPGGRLTGPRGEAIR